jgi:hypothetical protein
LHVTQRPGLQENLAQAGARELAQLRRADGGCSYSECKSSALSTLRFNPSPPGKTRLQNDL